MNKTGWFRVWVVSSVAIWIAGTVWLSRVEFPYDERPGGNATYTFHMPPIFFEASPRPRFCLGPPQSPGANPFEQFAPAKPGELPKCGDLDAIERVEKENWAFDWERWAMRAWSEGQLPLVVLLPFAIGALMIGIGWAKKGFATGSS